ncbi:sulfite exporter TauE/SafE family protein [Salicibibacter kimchii]|uniref:Probable membrane transporter protein n=1 Tax=Salicibibacter kimchii TaxID=2099786 RepID=A0A345C2X2_9BACI|nr:sulfite exporter TauE/SafE family protein [Salicibibacter kimchii]AXF57553.1 sulfite exporter TauE/SafE family protein [Salicibibacter kimchii]
MIAIALFSLIGVLIGITSSLFGFGGGFIVVPILYAFLPETIPADHVMHTAIGTSLAVMIVNSFNSTIHHAKNGNVRWDIFKFLFLFICIGSVFGGFLASFFTSEVLRFAFIAFLIYVIFSSIIKQTFVSTIREDFQFPTYTNGLVTGVGIGTVSTLLGIGGSVVTIPYLRNRGLRMLHAVALATPLGLPIAIVGTFMYLGLGIQVAEMPASTIGFIYLPALFGFVFGGFIGVPIGRKIAQKLPDALFSKVYLVLLIIVVIMMIE